MEQRATKQETCSSRMWSQNTKQLCGIFAISTANADVVTTTANFRADPAVAGGINTGGLKADTSGTAVDGGLLYANGSDV